MVKRVSTLPSAAPGAKLLHDPGREPRRVVRCGRQRLRSRALDERVRALLLLPLIRRGEKGLLRSGEVGRFLEQVPERHVREVDTEHRVRVAAGQVLGDGANRDSRGSARWEAVGCPGPARG